MGGSRGNWTEGKEVRRKVRKACEKARKLCRSLVERWDGEEGLGVLCNLILPWFQFICYFSFPRYAMYLDIYHIFMCIAKNYIPRKDRTIAI